MLINDREEFEPFYAPPYRIRGGLGGFKKMEGVIETPSPLTRGEPEQRETSRSEKRDETMTKHTTNNRISSSSSSSPSSSLHKAKRERGEKKAGQRPRQRERAHTRNRSLGGGSRGIGSADSRSTPRHHRKKKLRTRSRYDTGRSRPRESLVRVRSPPLGVPPSNALAGSRLSAVMSPRQMMPLDQLPRPTSSSSSSTVGRGGASYRAGTGSGGSHGSHKSYGSRESSRGSRGSSSRGSHRSSRGTGGSRALGGGSRGSRGSRASGASTGSSKDHSHKRKEGRGTRMNGTQSSSDRGRPRLGGRGGGGGKEGSGLGVNVGPNGTSPPSFATTPSTSLRTLFDMNYPPAVGGGKLNGGGGPSTLAHKLNEKFSHDLSYQMEQHEQKNSEYEGRGVQATTMTLFWLGALAVAAGNVVSFEHTKSIWIW